MGIRAANVISAVLPNSVTSMHTLTSNWVVEDIEEWEQFFQAKQTNYWQA